MEAKVYTREYSGVLCSWLDVRGLDTGLIQDLPNMGYVILLDNHPIVAGFLRACEGDHYIMDSFISDPTAAPEDRDKAMDLLFKTLIDHGKSIKAKQLIGFTVDSYTHSRAKRHGMKATSMTTFVLPLKG